MVYAGTAIYILVKAHRQYQFRLLSLLLFAFASWSLSAAVIHYPQVSRLEAEAAVHVLSLSISAYGILAFLNLAYFSGHIKKKKWVFFLFALYFLFQTFLQLNGDLLLLNESVSGYTLHLLKYAESPYLTFFDIIHNLLVISGFFMMFLTFRKTKSKLKRRQSSIILITGAIAYILASVNVYAVRFLYDGEIPVFTDFWLLIFAGGLYYTIVRLELFEVTPGVLSNRLIDILPAAFILTDSKNRIVRVNKITREFFGRSAAYLQDLNIQKLFDEQVSRDQPEKSDVFSDGLIRIIDKSGQEKHAYWYSNPVDEKDLHEQGQIFIITDIEALHKVQIELKKLNFSLETQVLERTADLKQAKERAEENDKLKTAFLQNLSHEIRTPLNAIVGFSSLLSASAGKQTELQNYTEMIQKSSMRLLVIVENILSISALESGNEKLSISEIDLHALIERLFQIFSSEAKLKQLELKIKKPSVVNDNSVFITDELKLRKIFEHLIDNALKFTASGYIEFGYEEQNADYRFFVKDTGCGIEKENQKVIFERFRQHSDDGKLNSGNGLGLTIADAYVKLLDSNLQLESSKGEGAEFYFYLPIK
jgi:PAS domain S-box-containing protein